MWNEIRDQVNKVHEAISGESINEGQYCNDGAWGNGANKDTNKKVCQYIVQGLQYIYNIKKETDRTKDQNPEDNWKYKTTMACLVLNAFIGELRKQKKTCNIEQGIKKAFENGGSLRKQLCMKDGCDECKEEYDPKCVIADKGIGPELSAKLQEGGSKMKQTLESICLTTPQKSEPASLATGSEKKGSEDQCKKKKEL
ncbi:SICA antigen [Plasmodium coatneyi]|uniref:SICA antigen n=1 Tax=Plasmodium coatneyi TaxID=208452 RepID=A0A1B1DWT9_9APIC|nr:SICA antigen [Plasmodium coatneyi]ANQ07214.1 SICA antigen [Plasmodium coatneyi]